VTILLQYLYGDGVLSADAAMTLVQVFISSRLDYCNSLLYGVSDGLMSRLQSAQNAAALLRRFYDSSIACPCVNE